MDVGFIPGIYNYCDRWCEKCEQQLRCMSFVMGKKIEEKGGFNFEREGHREDESIWARLKEVFESTYEVLHELAEERGLDVEDIYASENIDREFWGEDYEGTPREQVYQKLESSDLLRICSIYEYWADKCMELLYEIINDKEKISEILTEYLELYSEEHDKQEWFDTIKALAGKLGYASEVKEYKANPDAYPGHVGDVSTVLRIALTGRTNTPDMYEIMKIIGKERMEKRFKKVL